MTPEQLEKGRKLDVKIKKVEATIRRAKTIGLDWAQNGTNYHFSEQNLESDPLIVAIFENATIVVSAIVDRQLDMYLKSLTKQLEEL